MPTIMSGETSDVSSFTLSDSLGESWQVRDAGGSIVGDSSTTNGWGVSGTILFLSITVPSQLVGADYTAYSDPDPGNPNIHTIYVSSFTTLGTTEIPVTPDAPLLHHPWSMGFHVDWSPPVGTAQDGLGYLCYLEYYLPGGSFSAPATVRLPQYGSGPPFVNEPVGDTGGEPSTTYPPGTLYTCRVMATNANGASYSSAATIETYPLSLPPYVVSDVPGTGSSRDLIIRFTAPPWSQLLQAVTPAGIGAVIELGQPGQPTEVQGPPLNTLQVDVAYHWPATFPAFFSTQLELWPSTFTVDTTSNYPITIGLSHELCTEICT